MSIGKHRIALVALVSLAAGFVLGAASMRIYGGLDLKLRKRVRDYLEYRPPFFRLDCPAIAPSPIKRFEAATAVVDDKLYLFGGFDTGRLEATTRSDRYDPLTNSWTQVADLPAPVTHAGIAVVGHEIWIAGGFVGDHPGEATDAVWRYDTLADRFTPGPSLPEPRASAPLVRFERSLHYFGGLRRDRRTDSADHWHLDLDAPNGWTRRAPLPNARNHLAGIELDGTIYAIGGQHDHDGPFEDIAAVHAYDPADNKWRELASLAYGRSHFEPGTFTAKGKIVIAGGRANAKSVVYDMTAYDVASNTWHDLVPLDVAARAPTAALVANRVIVGLGGTLPSGVQPRAELSACTLDDIGLGD